MLDYLRLALGLMPLGLYLMVMGLLALRDRPTILTTGQETLLIGFALSGFVMIGPIELFFPTGAYAALGSWVWLLLVALYCLVVLLIALQRAPGWTIVGMDTDEFRTFFENALQEGSVDCKWMGNQLQIDKWDVRAIVEPSRGFPKTTCLSPCGRVRNMLGWYQIEKLAAISKAFEQLNAGRPLGMIPTAVCLLIVGSICIGLGGLLIAWDMDRLQKLLNIALGGP